MRALHVSGGFMAQKNSAPPPSSATAQRVAIIALAIAAAAIAYVVQLRARVAELEQRLASTATQTAPAKPEAAKPAAAAPAVATATAAPANLFTAEQKQAMIDTLRNDTDAAHKAWFLIEQRDPETASIAAAFREVFEQAGWPTETNAYPNPLKNGVFLLAGDTEPPNFVSNVNDALAAGGLDIQFLTGYREFVADRKKTPGWIGPELGAGQVFTLVIGGKPALKSTP